ncbi:hypothetical protein AB0L65_48280 [Nonomuraea sp. NPDC052116]|uniref:hypothetical protein n=1 Tax=Nonomuraea sp. NPDC052116 TaxID=3155665 RepID=UPI003424A5E2
MLGSLAAVLYRAELPANATGAVRESLGGAVTVARESGSADLVAQATLAFTESLKTTSLYGAILMLVAALAVWRLTPARLDLAAAHH